MRFDWYQGTWDDLDDEQVAPALALSLGARVLKVKGRLGYARGYSVQRGDDVLATVLESSARAREVHVIVTGGACDEVVPLLRRLWPAHRVSRADSAIDFAADFSVLDVLAFDFASRLGLKSTLMTNSDGGATRYIGSPTSEVRVRVYKKTEQQIALHPERAADVPAGIVRAELVARPGKRETKAALATLGPVALWGLGGWSLEFADEVLAIDAPRTITHVRRPADWDRALHFLGLQYGPSVARRVLDVGVEQAVGEVLAALGLAGGHA